MSWCINDVYETHDIAILNIWGFDYLCIINRITKSEAVNFLKNADLS